MVSRPAPRSDAAIPPLTSSGLGFESDSAGLNLLETDDQSTSLEQAIFGPSYGSIFGSARLALDPTPAFAFDYNLPYDPSPVDDAQNPSTGNLDTFIGSGGIDPSSLLLPLNGSDHSFNDTNRGPPQVTNRDANLDTGIPLSIDPNTPFPQIVSFATWEQIGFFLSLHMRHQHVLTPLVHQPTFARDLLHRRDIHDEAFRGLLMSIGGFTPVSIV